jgi:hypothetical protein
MSQIGQNSEQESPNDASSSLDVRPAAIDTHPVVQREYTLPTPMMNRTYNIVRERVWARRTSVVFYAPPRMGKTKSALEIQATLIEEFPSVYTLFLSARASARASEMHMFRLLLEASHHVLANRSGADLLFKNATTDVVLQISKRGGSQFVLIIDEAHLLSQTDFQQLVVFHNALTARQIKMTTIAFAQPEILHRRTALLTASQLQIIARFLSEPIAFEGCSSAAELKDLLVAYDDLSDFPEGSNWSYTRFFLPCAYSAGFRLSRYYRRIWEELTNIAGFGGKCAIPMEHICLSVEFLLLASRDQDCTSFSLNDADIEAAVDASNLASFSAILQGPKVSV